MKTRSRRYLGDDRETDSDESLFARSSKRRKRFDLRRRGGKYRQPDLNEKIGRYRQSLRLGMQLQYSDKNHLSENMGREHQSGEKLDKKSSPIISDPSHSNSNQTYVNGEENGDEKQNVRRSTRQRKFTYDNLNQTWLLAPSIPDFSKLEPLFASNESNSRDGECTRPRRSERNRNPELRQLDIPNDSLEFDDMYSRVKRERRKTVHDFYSRQINPDGSMADTEDTDQNGLSDLDTIGGHSDIEGGAGLHGIGGEEPSNETVNCTKYSLRPKKPITERFQFPIEPVRPRRSASSNIFEAPRHHQPPRERETFKSTAHKSHLYRRKRHAIHNSSSTSSSSDDERRFEKRKARSMARARTRCIPINFMEEDLNKGVLRDRMKLGCNLADIDPMTIDKSVSFDSVGGLDKHIQALKEMILFPLIYPEVFERFKITPPRGVLFHGQPGTGKTLVARALANECSNNDRRIAFFMRKGADCLSKWVGESERQLRLLFDQAYSMRPSIIFFDEIDGLAPVRSTRQDQIHSSIVSTLLALMDGLDNRGEIVIIGATNRIDAIDPALRRPGRFDRELLFPLPSVEAREKILSIHMHHWNPPQPASLIKELAELGVGYCGADLKALCTEAALVALRRRYPQIYGSRQKLQLDVNTIQVMPKDFYCAMKKMKSSVQRSSVFSAKPLPDVLKPLLERMLQKAKSKLKRIFPVTSELIDNNTPCSPKNSAAIDISSDESECSGTEDYSRINKIIPIKNSFDKFPRTSSRYSRYLWPSVHRPHFILSGEKGQGQGWLAPAILHLFQHIPVHRLDIPSLFAVTSRAPEEACAHIFHEAQRSLPSIIFLPHIGYWWETLSETVKATFLSLLQDLEPCTPLLLLATSDCSFSELSEEVQLLFSISEDQVLHMENPTDEERRIFFSCIMREIFIPPKAEKNQNETVDLPIAPSEPSRQLTAEELNKLRQNEEATLRELRLFLRDILNKLARDRRFYVFARPVDPMEVPDYQEVIQDPMDLETMMTKIDQRKYETVTQFLTDIDLVCQNALEYNPDRDPSDRLIRHRACAFKDIAHALVLSELDGEFEKICQDIQKARKERGESVRIDRSVTSTFSNTASRFHSSGHPNADPFPKASDCDNLLENSLPSGSATRFSKRIRGLDALPENENSKKENFNVPRRSARYMIWRKRKSPWFGGCRRKLIRRTVGNTSDLVARKKFKKCPKVLNYSAVTGPIVHVDNPTHTSNVAGNCDMNASTMVVLKSPPMSPDGTKSNTMVASPAYKSPPNHRSEQVAGQSTSLRISCDIFVDKNNVEVLSPRRLTPASPRSPTKVERTNQEGKLSDAVSPTPSISTRASSQLLNSPNAEPATAKPTVTVDIDFVRKFIDHVVKVTKGCTVEVLQHLYSLLQQCIYRHRREWDKQGLLEDFRKEMDLFCQRNLS